MDNILKQEDEKSSPHKPRTFGLKAFDVVLYPILTNFVVFGVSVAATYLTTHGDKTGGKIGKWFQKRGDWFKTKMLNVGMDEKQAEASKMIAFSFVDGSVMAPFIKKLEDKREIIAHAIDQCAGTEPEDKSVYEAEPKQGWMSVLGGRAAALAIVLPTGVALGKIGTNGGKWQWKKAENAKEFSSLNDKLFSDPGHKLGQIIEKKPRLAQNFGKLNIPDFMSIGIFEFFYTSVCTAGLYIASRAIARKAPAQDPDTKAAAKNHETTSDPLETRHPAEPAALPELPQQHYTKQAQKPASYTQRLQQEPASDLVRQ